MSDEALPAAVDEFLREFIHSFDQLEVLLRLAAVPGTAVRAPEIGGALGLSVPAAVDALEALARDKRIVTADRESAAAPTDVHYRFTPATPELAETVGQVGEAYRTRRLEVMNLMSAHALERVRTSAARAFAGAFVLRRKNDG